MADWLTSVYGFKVERREIRRSGGKPYYRSSQPPRGVLHTTENDTIEGAYRWLSASFAAPHFIIGEGRIIQCRPLSVQAAALRTNLPHLPNSDVWVQIEQVGRSQQRLYNLPPGTTEPTAAVMAALADRIPLEVPLNFPDSLTDVKPYPASNNTRRKRMEAIWPNWKGWCHHMEVPFQAPSWHWDSGALRRKGVLIPKARALREGDDMDAAEVRQIIEDYVAKHRVVQFAAGIFDKAAGNAATPELSRTKGQEFAAKAVAPGAGGVSQEEHDKHTHGQGATGPPIK